MSMKSFYRSLTALCVMSVLCVAGRAGASEASYVIFEVPGSLGTYPVSVNNSGAVTGFYLSPANTQRGFIREPNGTYVTFDVMGSMSTMPGSINDSGEITGSYEVNYRETRGFLRYADGHIISFAAPCTADCHNSRQPLDPRSIQPYGINAFGEIVGSFAEDGYPAGFRRAHDGKITTFEQVLPPAEEKQPPGLAAVAINDSGTVTGSHGNYGSYGTQSFIQGSDGYYVDGIIVPAPGTDAPYNDYEATIAEGINASGAIVGFYAGCDKPCQEPLTVGGFVRSPSGELTLFNPPGALVATPEPYLDSFYDVRFYTGGPQRLSINDFGIVTGSYTDSGGAQHGFVRNPYGTITSFDPPKGRQTTTTSINNSGVIIGTYLYDGTNPTSIGFLRIPEP